MYETMPYCKITSLNKVKLAAGLDRLLVKFTKQYIVNCRINIKHCKISDRVVYSKHITIFNTGRG